MVHCLFILWTHSSFAPTFSPFRLLDNHLLVVTVLTRGFSRIIGNWSWNALFFHFFFVDFILDSNFPGPYHFIFWGWFTFSVLKLCHCYFPFELRSIIGDWVGGLRSFKFKHLFWILSFFVSQMMVESYLCCFECCFYFIQVLLLHLFLGCTSFPHLC